MNGRQLGWAKGFWVIGTLAGTVMCAICLSAGNKGCGIVLEPLTVDEYVLRIVLARWVLIDYLRKWEDKICAEAGFILG